MKKKKKFVLTNEVIEECLEESIEKINVKKKISPVNYK